MQLIYKRSEKLATELKIAKRIPPNSVYALYLRRSFDRVVGLFLTIGLLFAFLSPVSAQNGAVFNRRRPEKNRSAQRTAETRSDSADSLSKASSSRQSIREAVERIPWNALSMENRERVESIIRDHSLYRRLPMAGGVCNPEIYDFLLCHPEIVIGLWQALGYSEVELNVAGPSAYRLHEASGTVADVRILYHDNNQMLVWCRGVYRSAAIARPLEGEAVGLLQYRFTEDARHADAPIVISRFDCFMRVENTGVEAISRMLAPLVGKIIDSNFLKTIDFVNGISETAEINPGGLAKTLQKVDQVDRLTLDDFLTVVLRTESQSYQRQRGERIDYYLLPKPNSPESVPARLLSRKNEPKPSLIAAAPAPKIIEQENIEQKNNDEPAANSETLTLSLGNIDTPEAVSDRLFLNEESGTLTIPELVVYQVKQEDLLPEGKRTMILLDPDQTDDPLRLAPALSTASELILYPPEETRTAEMQEEDPSAPIPFDPLPSLGPPQKASSLWTRPTL